MNLEQLFQNAINFQQQGNLDAAAQNYYAVIQKDNHHFGALVNLGSLLKQNGKTTDAMQCFQQALSVNQNSPELWFNYANLLESDDQIDAALQAFGQALSLRPDFYAAHFNLANLLRDDKQLEKAEHHYKQAIRLKPDFVRGYTNLGNVLRRLKKYNAALKAHKKAKSLNPQDANIYYNLGRAMIDAKKYDEALIELKQAIKLRENFVDARLEIAHLPLILKNPKKAESLYDEIIAKYPNATQAYIGKCKSIYQTTDHQTAFAFISQCCSQLNEQKEPADLLSTAAEFAIHCKAYDAAIKFCKKAIQLEPKVTKHLNLLGLALLQTGRTDEARKMWLQSIALNEKNEVDARVYLGQLAHRENKHDEAIDLLRLAIKIDPKRISSKINLGFVLLKLGVIAEACDLADALIDKHPESADAYVLKGFAQVQNASVTEASVALEKAISIHQQQNKDVSQALLPSVYSDSLFSCLYNDQLSATQIKTLHSQRCQQMMRHIQPRVLTVAADIDNRPLRVAYFSPDLNSHPVAFFLEPILANHNPKNCEIFCYSLSSNDDDMTAKLKKLSPHWRECAYLSDDEIIKTMDQDKVDIVIDLVGHTAKNRLSVLAKRAAAIQAIYLGYPSTTGLKQMDYIIADEHLVPAEFENQYSEKVMRLKGMSFLCYQAQPNTPDVEQPPCIKNGYITFGSFNNLPKISTSTISLWSKVLKNVANSRLVLKALSFIDEPTKNLFWKRFQAHGIEKHRIDLLPPTRPLNKFMEDYRLMDIALDSVPYNGGTTTCDALWMGVPVLTLSGEHFCSRMSQSILKVANMPEWVCHNESEFIQKARDFTHDKHTLAQLRSSQRQKISSSSLCDAQRFVIELERTYQNMVNDHKVR